MSNLTSSYIAVVYKFSHKTVNISKSHAMRRFGKFVTVESFDNKFPDNRDI